MGAWTYCCLFWCFARTFRERTGPAGHKQVHRLLFLPLRYGTLSAHLKSLGFFLVIRQSSTQGMLLSSQQKWAFLAVQYFSLTATYLPPIRDRMPGYVVLLDVASF